MYRKITVKQCCCIYVPGTGSIKHCSFVILQITICCFVPCHFAVIPLYTIKYCKCLLSTTFLYHFFFVNHWLYVLPLLIVVVL